MRKIRTSTPTLIYLALCKEKVVGMRGFYGAKWEVGDSRQTAFVLCAGDLVIEPEHRRRGLFPRIMATALTDLAARGYAYVFNLSASTVTKIWIFAPRLAGCRFTKTYGLEPHRKSLFRGKGTAV